MTLLGDIGGLYDFFVLIVTPCVSIIVGDRVTFYLLQRLFYTNDTNTDSIDKTDH